MELKESDLNLTQDLLEHLDQTWCSGPEAWRCQIKGKTRTVFSSDWMLRTSLLEEDIVALIVSFSLILKENKHSVVFPDANSKSTSISDLSGRIVNS